MQHTPAGTTIADHLVLPAPHAGRIQALERDPRAAAPVARREQGAHSQCLNPTLDQAVNCFVDAVKVLNCRARFDMSAHVPQNLPQCMPRGKHFLSTYRYLSRVHLVRFLLQEFTQPRTHGGCFDSGKGQNVGWPAGRVASQTQKTRQPDPARYRCLPRNATNVPDC